MNFLISLCFAAAFVALFHNSLKKHPNMFYIAAAIIAIVTGLCHFSDAPYWLQNCISNLFLKGVLSTAFFVIVMYSGAFKNGSKLIKALMPIRSELSIFASILALPHIIFYGKIYLKYMFSEPEKLGALKTIPTVLSLILLFIFVPLFITSFPRIRKKMNAKSWKRLQRTAYGFYALVYIHIMILAISYVSEGRSEYVFSALLYSLVFFVYAAMRIRKALFKRQSPLVSNVVPSAIASVLFAVVCAFTVQAWTSASYTVAAQAAPVQTDFPEVSPDDTDKLEPVISPTQSEIQSEAPIDESAEVTTPNPSLEESTPITIYKDGTYQGSGVGFLGTITVNATISNDLITAITVVTHSDDAAYFDFAWAGVTNSILSSQNINVDTVSGATFSAKGIRDAVADALSKALN